MDLLSAAPVPPKVPLPPKAEGPKPPKPAEPKEPAGSKEQTQLGKGPGAKGKQGKGLEGTVTQAEVTRAFFYMFSFVALVIRREPDWAEKDFERLGKAFSDLCNRYLWLRVVIVITAPLSTMGEIVVKVRELLAAPRAGRKEGKGGAGDAAA